MKTIKSISKVLFIFIIGIISAAILSIAVLGYFYIDPFRQFDPATEQIRQSSTVLDSSGNIVDYLFDEEIRFWRPLKKINSNLTYLVIFSEDDKFYQHEGIDIKEMEEALKKNIKKKRIARGGSTITQQLVKNVFLSKEKTLRRKLQEIPLSLKLEDEMTKREIIEAYINVIEWGPGIYGAEAASRYYFDKPASNLSIQECYFLALIIPNPNLFSPFYNPRKIGFIMRKQFSFVNRLFQEKKLPPGEYQSHLYSHYSFYNNRDPKDLSAHYPKIDLKNNEQKYVVFRSLENYLLKKHSRRQLYQNGLEIKLSVNKVAQNHLRVICDKLNRGQKNFKKVAEEDYTFIPVYKNGEIIAISQLVDSSPDLIKKLSRSLGKAEKLDPNKYRFNRIPWKKIIKTISKQAAVYVKN